MKIGTIETCTCCDHKPDGGDSVYYGMPHIKISANNDKLSYTAFCPNCGKTDTATAKSAHLALKNWNRMLKTLKSQGV